MKRCFVGKAALASAALVLACTGQAVRAADAKAGDSVFGLDKVAAFHLRLDAAEFKRMQPAGGMGFPGGAAKPKAAGAHRNTFGVDFPWAKGDLSFGGKTFKDVGVRYKGNYTHMAASRSLKKSLKADFNRAVEGQKLDGLKKLNFNSGVTDPSKAREALSYAFFRAAGVPAPRTSFAEVTLTVPGKYDKELLGLYTVVEQVDKGFLERHFKSGKGLLLKPEGLHGGLQHLGDDWKRYEDRYQPKGTPTEAQKKRLIAFTKLINDGTDAEFEKGVGGFLDVDAFLRFIAANALLSNLDSYLGFGHNYYLYLVPGTGKFVFIPWDLDLSLAAWPAVGTPEQLVQLDLTHPHAGQNKLIDRLLALKDVKARYKKILAELAKGPFAKAKLLAGLDAVEKAAKAPIAREKKAVAARKETGGFGAFGGTFGASLPPRAFFEKRTDLVAMQLAGKAKGYEPRSFGFGGPGGGGRPGGGGFGPPGGFNVPRVGDVMPRNAQDRLKLTRAQKRKMAELQKEVESKIQKILDDEQKAEWKKLRDAQPGFGPGGGRPGGR